MTTSYNGWPASDHPADFGGLDNSPIPGTGVQFAPGFRAGDVAFVFQQFFTRFNARVERLVSPGCWGYNFRPSKNDSNLMSCHGSATAGDANAPKHPNGKRGTFTAAQVAEIRKLLAEFDNVIHWGGDGWGPGSVFDEMHFEIGEGKTADDVAAVAAKLRGSGPVQPPGSRVLQQGMSGNDVRVLQHVLNAWYPALPKLAEDGQFGPATTDRVKYMQAHSGLTVDGIVGAATKRVLHLP